MKRLFAMIKSLFAQSGDMMDVGDYLGTVPCGDCSTGKSVLITSCYPPVQIHNH